MMVMSELQRNKDLLRKYQDKQDRNKGEELLRLLPQGPGSGLNADLLDDMHAKDIIEDVLVRLRQKIRVGGGGGGYSLEVHGADKHDHTTWYAAITPAGAILPASGAPAQTKVTGTNFTYYVLDFDPDTAESIYAQFKLPPNYTPGSSLKIVIQWISTVTSGAVKWGAQILGRADGETFDSAFGSEATVTTTTDGTAGKINTSEISISPDLAAEDVFILKMRRIAADVPDTMDADARVVMIGIAL